MTILPLSLRRRLSCTGGIAAALLLLLFAVGAAHAQVEVSVTLNRHVYIEYEPIVATITINNFAGRDITLEDVGGKQWFNVEVFAAGGTQINPYDPDYKLSPLHIAAGETVKRQLDISPLFPIREMGPYRLRANLYFADADKFIGSTPVQFDLTDGKVIWRQDVGVPGSGELRQLSLLTHRLPDKMLLYARVRDEANNVVYTTQQLGRLLVSGREPEEMLDRQNRLHILQNAAPKTYLYTIIGLDGQRIDQKVYTENQGNHMVLARTPDGGVGLRGGQIQVAAAKGFAPGSGVTADTPKISDRPVGLGMPKAAPREMMTVPARGTKPDPARRRRRRICRKGIEAE